MQVLVVDLRLLRRRLTRSQYSGDTAGSVRISLYPLPTVLVDVGRAGRRGKLLYEQAAGRLTRWQCVHARCLAVLEEASCAEQRGMQRCQIRDGASRPRRGWWQYQRPTVGRNGEDGRDGWAELVIELGSDFPLPSAEAQRRERD